MSCSGRQEELGVGIGLESEGREGKTELRWGLGGGWEVAQAGEEIEICSDGVSTSISVGT